LGILVFLTVVSVGLVALLRRRHDRTVVSAAIVGTGE